MPASSRTSRTAACRAVSPVSTWPLGNCQRGGSPTEISAMSSSPLLRRTATPLAEISVLAASLPLPAGSFGARPGAFDERRGPGFWDFIMPIILAVRGQTARPVPWQMRRPGGRQRLTGRRDSKMTW